MGQFSGHPDSRLEDFMRREDEPWEYGVQPDSLPSSALSTAAAGQQKQTDLGERGKRKSKTF
jgi:hypothetical protein